MGDGGRILRQSAYVFCDFLDCSKQLSHSHLSPCSFFFFFFWPLSKFGPWVQFSPAVLERDLGLPTLLTVQLALVKGKGGGEQDWAA